MGSLGVTYRPSLGTADTSRRPSRTVWGDCPWLEVEEGRVDGVQFKDDFEHFGLPGTQTTEIQNGKYKVFSSTAGVFTADTMPHAATSSGRGGIISCLADTDGDSHAIGTQNCPFFLTTTQTVGKLWFEARVAITGILTNAGQFFLGLADNRIGTFSATLPLGNANVQSTTLAMIGFNRLEDGLGVLNTSHSDVGATAWTDIQASAGAIASETWIKLGMVVDFSDSTNFITFTIDGVPCTTTVSKATILALSSLDVVGLGPCMAFFADSAGTSNYTYIDWWRACQTFEAHAQ